MLRRTRARNRLGWIALTALLAVIGTGVARADTDGIMKLKQVNDTLAAPITCSFTEGSPSSNTTGFSFDISWVDRYDRAYFLADRSSGNSSSNTQGGALSGATSGDVLMIDINSDSVTALTPPANDPFAGVRCDANANFGGSNAAGRNEITGPNGVFTVNHSEAWVGDGPSYFTPGQTDSASDYNSDPCNSSVRVFNLISHQQTDHINLGGCFRTDEGAFDQRDQVALFANPSEQPLPNNTNAKPLNNSPFISLIDTHPVIPGDTHTVLKQINFDGTNGTVNANGGIEQAVWSPKTGDFYISIPGNSANPTGGYVAVVDPKNETVIANYGVNNCSPNGAALGADYQLLLGCSVGPEQVIDIRTGSVIAVLTGTTGGCDEVAYDAADRHFAGACTDTHAPFDNLDVSDAHPVSFDVGINTGAAGAHSITADPVTVTEWMPMFGGACGSGTACVAVYGSTSDDRGGGS